MKRKKWSELEEQTLLNKYSDLNNSGVLVKLKTREKKFKPIADHVNSVHHLQDPVNFPFKWCWRDVSIKVQNMRHQYLGVKQKIKVSNNEFNWKDGENHWENFMKYKEVFGDVELSEAKDHNNNIDYVGNVQKNYNNGVGKFGDNMIGDEGVMGSGFPMDSEESEAEEEEGEGEEEEEREMGDEVGVSDGEFGGDRAEKEEVEDLRVARGRKLRKGIGGRRLRMVGGQVLELREAMMRKEERRREREWNIEEGLIESKNRMRDIELRKEMCDNKRNEQVEIREMETEERQILWARRESERRSRFEKEFDEDKRRRMKLDEKLEEEEMEWREKMMELQIEHEKRMAQMHADACQNQMQVLGIMARLLCQLFGSANDGLAVGLGTLPPQDLQDLHHPGGLGDGVKPEANSPAFL